MLSNTCHMLSGNFRMLSKDCNTMIWCVRNLICCVKLDNIWIAMYFSDGRTLGTMCTCEEIERGTHACRASKQGPVERLWTQDGKLGITSQGPPPRVQKTDTFTVFYLFVLHSVMGLKTCHFAACFTILWTSICVLYVNTARDVVTVLLIFAKYLSYIC